jgi:NH3-dependent NAD+ synthetase
MDSRLAVIIDWLRASTGIEDGRGALVPVSGGSDGGLCFWLCCQAFPPGTAVAAFSGQKLRCRDWFESLGPVRFLPEPERNEHVEAGRWAMMLSEALATRRWLVGTRNRTEQTLGTYSLASRVATCLPLARLWKSEVMELCRSIGMPEAILESSRRADPSCGRPNELAEIPFDHVDLFLQVRCGERPEAELQRLAPGALCYLDSLYKRNRFKTRLPIRLSLDGQAWGMAPGTPDHLQRPERGLETMCCAITPLQVRQE